jgi:hypothetical protein
MDEQRILFSGLASLPILVPIGFAIRAYTTAGLAIRLFLFFLLIGLATDLTMWFLIYNKHYEYLLPVFNAYSLVDSLFCFWLIRHLSVPSPLKKIATVCLWLMVPFWLSAILIKSIEIPFDTAYEIVVAFLSGFLLLKIAESEGSVASNPFFWLLLGIFFYCFTTFFLMTLLGTEISQKVWWLNNVLNLITYILFAIGLSKAVHK